mgnify:FL=1
MKRKKVGCVIACRENHTNYGSSLVNYAFIKKLQELGAEVEIIIYKKTLSFPQKMAFVVNAILAGEWKDIAHRIIGNRLVKNHQYDANVAIRTKVVNEYRNQRFSPYFHEYVGYETLHKESSNYDIVVVGSDQVWTPLSLPNKYFNLLFVDDNVPKASYASSFGVSEIPAFQRKATGKYLNRFKMIGVREISGKKIVESLSHNKAIVVADPTLLLDKNEWEQEIKDVIIDTSEKYIFCYFLGTNQEARYAANQLKKKTGYKIITIRHMDEYVPEDENFGDEAPYYVGPNEFVKYISQAAYVCTDSFHCTAFSIQFQKPFMTFYRFSSKSKTSKNTRIDSLFSMLEIDRKHIYNGDISLIDSPINWENTSHKLKQLRYDSIEFMKKILSL